MTGEDNDHTFRKLPDHLLIEIWVRLPICEWGQISSVSKHWAAMFRGESLWETAIVGDLALAGQGKWWPGPIPQVLGRRRYAALYTSEFIVALDGEIGKLLCHIYLHLKEQLELSIMLPPSSIHRGTIMGWFSIFFKIAATMSPR